MLVLPNKMAPFVDALKRILAPWDSYLQQFTQAPPNYQPLTVGASPFAYTAKEPGNLAITGGTVTGLALIRGEASIILGAGTNKIIPMSINDIVNVVYSVLPTIQFVPSYGQNTTL